MARKFGQLPASAKDVSTFTVHLPDQDIEDMKQLIKLSKIAKETFENTQEDRRYGVTTGWLAEAKQHWLKDFDWRKTESKINSLPNFKASIEDNGEKHEVHFIALFSKKADAVPVISVHGWPGSFLEFLPMLELVSKQYTPETLPYHLIVPSLPGYAFSSKPPIHKNFDLLDATRILHKIMLNLGFSAGYVATGGDIGSSVATIMASTYEECKALQVNFCPIIEPPKSAPIDKLSAADQELVKRGQEFMATGHAYALEQGTRPGTLGLALQSNPMALLAWIGEKFLTWSDEDPDLDIILEDVTLWWLTETMPSSCYPYRMRFEGTGKARNAAELYVKKPYGYSLFPKELLPAPRAWVESTGDLSWFRQHETGGHFAALEKPAEMKQDLEDFLSHVVEEKGVKIGR